MIRPILLFLAAASLWAAADYNAEGKLWWAHIQFLADDKLQGRDTGSEGYRSAVTYVSGQMERFGLRPAGTDGYSQPVKFHTRQLIEAESSLELIHSGQPEPLKFGEDVTLNPRADLPPSFDAPLVFVGSGLVIPEANYNDLASLDLKGKIAIYINGGGPQSVSGNIRSHYASGAERWNALRQAGAIGMGTMPGIIGGLQPDTSSTPRDPRPAPPALITLADPSLQDAAGMQLSLTITRVGAAKFLAGTGHTLPELQALLKANQPLPTFALPGTLRAKAVVKRGEMEASNVAGLLPGSDPTLKNEYVIMSSHLDHLGTGRAVNGDALYNGAMDNASGVASVLEIARLLKESGVKPKRSILFLAVTAEEKGELGSRYFAAHPTVPARQIVADINLDMFMPLYALKVIEVQGLAESTLGESVRAAAKEQGIEVQADREPEQNRFIRSDQYSFIRNGIPSLAFKFGYEFGSPEETIRKTWVKDRYHKPSDDLSQPVDTAAAAQFDRVIASLLTRVANDPKRPEWNQDSFFKRFAK